MHSWTFLTNYAHTILCLARDPGIRISEVAREVGITERAAARILHDLAVDGYISSERIGRRNHYTVHADRPLRHPLEQHRTIGDLLGLLGERIRRIDE
jgi:predicted transcriptional regulator